MQRKVPWWIFNSAWYFWKPQTHCYCSGWVELETTSDSTEERVADLESTTNVTIRGLTELGNIVNATTDTVEEHEVDIQGGFIRLTLRTTYKTVF